MSGLLVICAIVALFNPASAVPLTEDLLTATGPGPVTASGSTVPWGLCISGNGFRAEAAGAGVTKGMYDTHWLGNLTTISSVSGGTWFKAQYTFSESYRNGLLTKPIKSWFQQYQQDALTRLGPLFGSCPNCWTDIVNHMFNNASDAAQPATAAHRHTSAAMGANAELLVGTTLVGEGLMTDNSTTQIKFGDSNIEFELPAYWTIASAGTGEWVIPKYNIADLKVHPGKNSAPWTPRALSLPTPTAGTVASMSSAASGATAAPALRAMCKPQDQFCSVFPCSGAHLDSVATCSDASANDINHCAFPSVRFIDGAFTENLGLAINVGHLQKKFPGKPLRLFALSNNGCDRKTDPLCHDSIRNTSIFSMFANAPYSEVAVWLPYIVPAVNRQIFKESVTEAQVVGKELEGGMSFMTGTFTTVANKYFGITAGSTVELILLNTNSEAPLQPSDAASMSLLDDCAQYAYDNAKKIIETLQSKGCVSSASSCQ